MGIYHHRHLRLGRRLPKSIASKRWKKTCQKTSRICLKTHSSDYHPFVSVGTTILQPGKYKWIKRKQTNNMGKNAPLFVPRLEWPRPMWFMGAESPTWLRIWKRSPVASSDPRNPSVFSTQQLNTCRVASRTYIKSYQYLPLHLTFLYEYYSWSIDSTFKNKYRDGETWCIIIWIEKNRYIIWSMIMIWSW